MTTTLTLNVRGPLTVGGITIRCPGREGAPAPRRLSLLVSGNEVMATCGEMHRGKDNAGRHAKCFFAVERLTPAMVKLLSEKVEPGKRFRVTMPGGKTLEGRRGPAAPTAPAGGGTAAAAFAAKKAAAKGGARPAGRRGGGTAAAAFNAVAAVAGSATAAANAAGAAAGAVGKGFDMGREGMKTGQAAIQAADNIGARRFARENRSSDSDSKDE